MSDLFSSFQLRGLTLKNRIAMPPMCQYSAHDGIAGTWHVVHYGTRAVGGAGLIIVEATAVAPEGRITPGDLGIWSDEHIEGLKLISDAVSSNGSVPAIQIAHAGRKASCDLPWNGGKQLALTEGGWETVAPSSLPFHPSERTPGELSPGEIKKTVGLFAAAAQRAIIAQFRAIEIHAAHGYLIQEFLSPLSNKRTDEYGGSFDNRIRLLVEVVVAVRKVLPDDFPLIVRISASEWVDGGWTIDDSKRLAVILKENGTDLIDCSSGGNIHDAKIPFSPGYQVPFAEAVRSTGIATGAVGLITTGSMASSIISEGRADIVMIGRELLRNPYFPLYAARDLQAENGWPLQYLRAK